MRAVVVSHTYLDPAKRGKLRALAGLGCAVSVALPDPWLERRGRGGAAGATWGDDMGVRIIPVPVRGSRGGSRTAVWNRWALRRLMSDFRPDIVQIEEEPGSPAALSVAREATRLGVPAVQFTWESVGRPQPFMVEWRRRRTLRRARGLIGGNRMAANLMAKSRPGVPVAIIPQLGITPPLYTPHEDHPDLAIAFVGRLVPEKGLDILFRASVKVAGRWRLTVIGTGPAQEELERLAERLGIAARITWAGVQPPRETAKLWPHVDCLVVPSRTTPQWVETYHPALVEAMGHGVPVVGSDSGALPELIDTAGLVVPEDDVEHLTAALQHLCDAPRERERFGKEGRHRVLAQYVDDAVARRTLEFWETVTTGGAKG